MAMRKKYDKDDKDEKRGPAKELIIGIDLDQIMIKLTDPIKQKIPQTPLKEREDPGSGWGDS